ncbi:hypothetical protein VB737_10565 [Synechococcus sp. BA-120 BA3]|nr:hypothetical protein [Synechococcus sp. BA-120 BA3]
MTSSPLRPLLGCLALLLAAPLVGPSPALAQMTQEQAFQRGRAANLARMRAELINGGLGVYRSAPCMYERSGGSCLVRADADGFLFRFFGGVPGWAQLGLPPTVESEILVAPDGRNVLGVVYNGPPRSQPAPAGQGQAQPGP